MMMMVPAVVTAPVAAVTVRVLAAFVVVSAILVAVVAAVMGESRAVTKGEQQRERACRGEAQ
jgi:hypothetical protein